MQDNNQFNYTYPQNGSTPQPGYPQPPVNLPPPYGIPPMSEEMKAQIEARNRVRNAKRTLIKDGFLLGATVFLYLMIQTIIILLVQKLGYYPLFQSSSLFQSAVNILAVHVAAMAIPYSIFVLILRKRLVGPLIPREKLEKLTLCAWVAVGMGVCVGANYLTNGVIALFKSLGYELTQPELVKPDSLFALLMTAIAVAIVPAIFEEYAFRCCVMGVFRSRGKFFAVLATSIFFGLSHGNVIQFIFAFCVGMILGYITLKTDSVIPAMIVHGCNNGLSVVQDACTYFFGSKPAEYITAAVIIAWGIAAVWGLIYLVRRKDLIAPRPPKEHREKQLLSFGQRLLCLLPGMVVPLALLLYMTATTIKKI